MIYKTLFSALIAFSLISCSNDNPSVKKSDTVYCIIKHYSPQPTQDTSDVPPPPPAPRGFYGMHNFILVDTSKILYHYRLPNWCGTGRGNYTRPEMIHLAPDSLTELTFNNLEDFLKSKISYSIKAMGNSVTASISSPGDTIKNRAYKIITDYFAKEGVDRYAIRNWTEEEMYVTRAKINNQKYDPDSINWKVGFDGHLEPPKISTVEFLPPKIMEELEEIK